MQLRSVYSLFLVLAVGAIPVCAQEPAAAPELMVRHLWGPLHRIEANEVNMLASVGEDGILLVDTGYPGTAAQVQQELAKLGPGPVRIIVNTHGDPDHVGGNSLLGKDAVIISSTPERVRMNGYFALPARDPDQVADMTVDGEATIHFNGDVIKLMSVGGGHRTGDLAVYFTGEGVFCAGDLVLSTTFPDADRSRGGDAQRLLELLRGLVRTLPARTLLVPGHGPDLGMPELTEYVGMVEATIDAVSKEHEAGHPLAEILEHKPLKQWASWAGPGAIGEDGWTMSVFSSLVGETMARSVCEPVSEALVNEGVDQAVRVYRLLRKEQPHAWNFDENELNRLGYELLMRDMVQEAVAVFRLNVEAFPDSFNPYDSLGEAYLAAGETELAVTNYRRSLELNPDNTNAEEMIARITSGTE